MASVPVTSSVTRSAVQLAVRQSYRAGSRHGLRVYTVASPVATTSKVTLSGLLPNGARSGLSSRSLHTRQNMVTIGGLAPTYSPTILRQRRRGMATITRQPESPEEPEVFSGSEPPSITLTQRAIDHLAKVSEKQKDPDLALRVAVEPGGCHGYQYKMEITNQIEEDDFRFSSGDNVHLVIDSTSLRLIKGSTIDYVTELIGSQFAILNNPQAKGAGCGCGVSWEPII